MFRFSFGDQTASVRATDAWTVCCDIYLQAQLARRAQLQLFCMSGEQLFTLAYVDDAVICSWSQEHVFAAKRGDLVRSCETLVEQAVAGLSDDRRDQFVRLGASLMQNDPRFAALEFQASL